MRACCRHEARAPTITTRLPTTAYAPSPTTCGRTAASVARAAAASPSDSLDGPLEMPSGKKDKDTMTVRIGINGFGRMGRLALRAGWGAKDIEFVHVNELQGGPETAAHLLTFDSIHGRWPHEV